jgi:hypothetical protein
MRSPYPDLCSSVIWALKQFNKIRPVEMAQFLDTKEKSVRDEIRRLYEFSMLKNYILREKTSTAAYYSLTGVAKDSSVEFLKDIATKTWRFNRRYKSRRGKR